MISEDDIRRAVSLNAFKAGQQYQGERRVRKLHVRADGGLIEAEVRGGDYRPYRQSIMLAREPSGETTIMGACSCPVEHNCKHVAAVLLEARKQAGPKQAVAELPAAIEPLPPEVGAWLSSLAAAQEEESEDFPPGIRKRLIYVMLREPRFGTISIDLQSIEIKHDGTRGKNTTRLPAYSLLRPGNTPKFLRPSDRAILWRLNSLGSERGEELITTLQRMIGTGRARWASSDGPVVTAGEPVAGELAWEMAEDGLQHPRLCLPGPCLALQTVPPWYVNPASGAMGPVATALPPRLLAAMLNGPAVAPALAERVRNEMTQRWPGRSLPAPAPVAPPKRLKARLQPQLRLLASERPLDPALAGFSDRAALARLSWGYGPVTIRSNQPRKARRIVRNEGVLLEVVHDFQAEAQAWARIHELGLSRIPPYFVPGGHPHAGDFMLLQPDPADWVDFMLQAVPELRAAGWRVDVADDFPWRLAEPDGGVSFEIHESSGIDWFDLDLGVMLDGQRISLAPALLEYIASGAADRSDDVGLPLLLPLPDGRLLAMPSEQLQPILAPLFELFGDGRPEETGGLLRLSRRDAGDLAALEAASGVPWVGGEAVRALGRQLREHGGIPRCPAPAGFQATLRHYQEQGLGWLQFLREAGLSGVLADDMGLGKTVQALAHLAVEQDSGRLDRPALVVCPTSLVPNWQAEAARFAPSLRTLVLHGPDRGERFEAIGRHDLVITTYPLLARDHAALTEQDWHIVLLDEAQMIKNPRAITSKLARTLRARQRLCLSGTPLENHLGELWSLFDFLLPGFLGDIKQFGARYRTPIEKAGNTERQALLAQRVAPFLLRRTKEQVAPDLPAKTDIAETVELGRGQRALYESIRLAMHAKVRTAIAQRGLAGSGIIILDALLKLRQACCDPRLVKLASAKKNGAGSAKLERLVELLPAMLEEGRRVLLFSQFTSMLALIEAELDRLGIPHVLLTGDTKDRAQPIQKFQAGDVPLFLISLKAGGTGLNLTAADTVIHYDPWWNPAVENQATDRAHRIGQDKPVFVHRLTTAGTIEEKMEVLKQRKQALASGVLGADVAPALSLTEADLDVLLAP